MSNLFYRASDRELLTVRNKIFKETGIPSLENKGFSKSPFRGIWFGEYDRNVSGYSYELCRLTKKYLEIITVYIVTGDSYINISMNIFELYPETSSLSDLHDCDGVKFHLPPNSISKMRLRNDDYTLPPLLYMLFLPEHKIGKYISKQGFYSEVAKLKKLIKKDMENIDYFVKRWHELHVPVITDWVGCPVLK
ncbi:hypothetical protein [Cellulophaga sp. BC115SP]|uniref:hypothetical protein n=1 Tax=Cellulophaga sp. BC115SP TaxID=2683263 RepID=UPI0014126FBA|nr:hypothetical protein [Cellulophaga sp. BC115SP]NBB32035.1 hypothetical protein [Cellulophaga sp. BC115SP]